MVAKFLLDLVGIPGPIYGSQPFANLNDVTLANQDINSILTDNVNMAIQVNVAMQMTQPGGQLWNQILG